MLNSSESADLFPPSDRNRYCRLIGESGISPCYSSAGIFVGIWWGAAGTLVAAMHDDVKYKVSGSIVAIGGFSVALSAAAALCAQIYSRCVAEEKQPLIP